MSYKLKSIFSSNLLSNNWWVAICLKDNTQQTDDDYSICGLMLSSNEKNSSWLSESNLLLSLLLFYALFTVWFYNNWYILNFLFCFIKTNILELMVNYQKFNIIDLCIDIIAYIITSSN